MDPLSEIRKIYFNATASTIQRDLARAIDLLKGMTDDDSRQRAAVYMDGLSEMRTEWHPKGPKGRAANPTTPKKKR